MYFVFDGRATYDIDRAMVLEVIGTKSEKQAVREFKRGYKHTDSVLADENQEIIMYDVEQDYIF